jgi:hypothetical protein
LNEKYQELLTLSCPSVVPSIKLISLHANAPQLKLKYPEVIIQEESSIKAEEFLEEVKDMKPGRPIPDKELQLMIIHQVIKNEAMPFDDENIFVTDEFARKNESKKLAADIFGFNKKTNICRYA